MGEGYLVDGNFVYTKNMSALYQKHQGFTLIEILVVAAVIGIMVGGGMATYAKFDKRQKVEQAALGFANQLRVVQKKADAGQRVNCPLNELDGYAVVAVNTASQATEYEACSSGYISIGVLPLAHRATFSDSSDDGMGVVFRTLGRGVNTSHYSGKDGLISVADIDTTIQYEVEVTTGGYITVEKIL